MAGDLKSAGWSLIITVVITSVAAADPAVAAWAIHGQEGSGDGVELGSTWNSVCCCVLGGSYQWLGWGSS